MTPPLEHDYIGLSETANKFTPQGALNLKDTELRLGLPGSELPERVDGEVVGLSLGLPVKNFVSGAKRGFFDAIDGSGEWGLSVVNGSEVEPGKYGGSLAAKGKNASEKHLGGINAGMEDGGTTKAAPPPKAQVVGWPPIRSYRKNTMAANPTKNKEDAEGKQCLYVKVSMDGAPYLRKVDLKTYSNYHELSLGLEKMFTCFSIGQCGSHVMSNREKLTEGRVMDLLQGSEYVLTYEDKDGDWMLIGDVPWEMFTDSCRKLRIMKGSDAIGIAPKAIEKSRNRNIASGLQLPLEERKLLAFSWLSVNLVIC